MRYSCNFQLTHIRVIKRLVCGWVERDGWSNARDEARARFLHDSRTRLYQARPAAPNTSDGRSVLPSSRPALARPHCTRADLWLTSSYTNTSAGSDALQRRQGTHERGHQPIARTCSPRRLGLPGSYNSSSEFVVAPLVDGAHSPRPMKLPAPSRADNGSCEFPLKRASSSSPPSSSRPW